MTPRNPGKSPPHEALSQDLHPIEMPGPRKQVLDAASARNYISTTGNTMLPVLLSALPTRRLLFCMCRWRLRFGECELGD